MESESHSMMSQLFWDYKQPKRAEEHLEKWMRSAMRSRLEPFKKLGRISARISMGFRHGPSTASPAVP